jgi:hypothetical protein
LFPVLLLIFYWKILTERVDEAFRSIDKIFLQLQWHDVSPLE